MNRNDFEIVVNNFLNFKDKENNLLKMDSVIISDFQNSVVYKHLFNKEDILHPVRSVCKSVVSMCYGILLENNKNINLDSYVWPIIENKVTLTNTQNLDKLKKIKLIHLFTHTIGFSIKLLKSKDVMNIDSKTYLDLVCNTNIDYIPGEHFLYSNAAPFLLSVVFQELTGINLAIFAEKNIFDKIGIKTYKWKNYGKYCAGSTGLELKSDDLHKIALLIANDGKWNGSTIIPISWMKNMKRPQILTPSMFDSTRVFPKYAYGLLMWLCGDNEDSNYFIDGSDGQYILIIPSKQLVITTLAHQKDMKPITECIRFLL